MVRTRHRDEAAPMLRREIGVHRARGGDGRSTYRQADISDATYDMWRELFGGMGRLPMAELKAPDQIPCPKSE